VWKAGVIRGLLVGGVLAVCLVNGLPHFNRAGGGVGGLRAAVQGLGEGLAVQASRAVSYRFNFTPTMGIALLGLLALVLVQVLFAGGDSVPPAFSAFSPDEAYAAGFKDGSNGMEYGTSKPASLGPSVPSSSVSGGFGLSSLLSLGLLGKTAYDLGKTPNGGWDLPIASRTVSACLPFKLHYCRSWLSDSWGSLRSNVLQDSAKLITMTLTSI